MEKGKLLKGALTKAPKEKPVQRVSPGVYRGEKGNLVTSKGRVLPKPSQPTPQQVGNAIGQLTPMPQQVGDVVDQLRPMGNWNQSPMLITEQQPNLGPLYTPMTPAQVGQSVAQIQPGIANLRGNWEPQPSANQGGKYRLSPGVYGTREQAIQQQLDFLKNTLAQGQANKRRY
jgi:hypothetical protein